MTVLRPGDLASATGVPSPFEVVEVLESSSAGGLIPSDQSAYMVRMAGSDDFVRVQGNRSLFRPLSGPEFLVAEIMLS